MLKQSRRDRLILFRITQVATHMVQGSLVALRGSCGKPSCACAGNRDRAHLRHYLSWTEGGRTRMLYIPQDQLEAFRQATRAWAEFKRLSQQLARRNALKLKLEREIKKP